ncbi:hypothetical protein [Nonomuraea sp. NPDC050310]|uniref:zinc finger domain-containing protein n=1 Tax=Nonomuraea sp. NPDC050310 TaxID=3154935 RepID=UPI0033E5A68F
MAQNNRQRTKIAKAQRRKKRQHKSPSPTSAEASNAVLWLRERLDPWLDADGIPLPPPSAMRWLTGLDDLAAAHQELVRCGLYTKLPNGRIRVDLRLRAALEARPRMPAEQMRQMFGLPQHGHDRPVAKEADMPTTHTKTLDATPGDAATLPDLAADLVMISVALRQLALRAERLNVPLEMGKTCTELELQAQSAADVADRLSRAHSIIQERQPVSSHLQDGSVWGDHAPAPKNVLTLAQLLALSGTRHRSAGGIAYLDAVKAAPVPFSSQRAKALQDPDERRAREIAAFDNPCPTCGATPQRPCVTKTGRVMAHTHKPRPDG